MRQEISCSKVATRNFLTQCALVFGAAEDAFATPGRETRGYAGLENQTGVKQAGTGKFHPMPSAHWRCYSIGGSTWLRLLDIIMG